MTEEYKLRIYDYANGLMNLCIVIISINIVLMLISAMVKDIFLFFSALFFLYFFACLGQLGNRRRIILELPDMNIPVVYLEHRNYILSHRFNYKTRYKILRKGRFGFYHRIKKGDYNA